MNTHKCPVADKVFNKLVSQLQDVLVLLDAQDRSGRLDFLKFRNKVVSQYGLKTFHEVLTKANGGLHVKSIYSGGTDSIDTKRSSKERNGMSETTVN